MCIADRSDIQSHAKNSLQIIVARSPLAAPHYYLFQNSGLTLRQLLTKKPALFLEGLRGEKGKRETKKRNSGSIERRGIGRSMLQPHDRERITHVYEMEGSWDRIFAQVLCPFNLAPCNRPFEDAKEKSVCTHYHTKTVG